MDCRLRAAKDPEGTQRVNRLALGTVQFGLPYGIANLTGQVSRPEAKKMLQLALTKGIDTLDTAMAYGESEARLGELGTNGFKLVTKLPPVPDGCTDISGWIRKQVDASLARLGVTEVYGLLLHRSEQLLGPNGQQLYLAMQALRDRGQVKNVGISIYSPNELEAVTKVFQLDLVQAPFNLVDRRLRTTGWLKRLKEDGVEIHIRSVFLQGLLLMQQSALPPKFAPWSDLWQRWHKWLSDHNVSAIQACLAFPLAFPEIDRVVVGADTLNQLAQIFGAVSGTSQVSCPDLQCEEENLINPSRWPKL